jgi:heme/copper-type cytochrome/quinol oxidase subunit 4
MLILTARVRQEIEMMNRGKPLSEKGRGVVVFAVLAVITAFEFVVALSGSPVTVLVVLALIKAGLVLNYFMHFSRLFSAGEGGR